jgi:transcriptional regulator with XRE-family HTH domain
MPAIIDFLGYDPLPSANTLAEQLVRQRTSLGLVAERVGETPGCPPGTLARWERKEREPTGVFLNRVRRFVADKEAQSSETCPAGWLC